MPPASSEFLASVVECSDDAIVTKDLDGRVTSWNKSAERIFGYTAEEMIGQPISILAAPDRIDEMPSILARVSRGERIDHYQTVRKTKDGRLIDISLTVSPVKDGRGRIIGASKIARDITEQVRTAERLVELNAALQKSEAEARKNRDWLETMLIGIGDAVIATDAFGKITLLNKAAESLTGWARKEAIGRPLEEVFVIRNEDTGAAVESPVSKALRLGQIVGLANHTSLIAKDGRVISIDDSAAPFSDVKGSILGIVLVFRDVGSRRIVAKQLAAQAAELRRTTHLLEGIACFVRDLQNRIVYWNPGATVLYGFSADEAVGRVGHSLLKTEFPASLPEILAQVMTGGAWDGELLQTRRDGAQITVASHWALHTDADGQPVAILEVNIDITRRKEAEQQLVQLKDQLAEELAGTRGLHELGPRLLAASDWRALLSEILTAALAITGADMGNIQLLDDAGALRIEAQHGFSGGFLEFFNTVHEGEASACSAALDNRERIVVEDVEKSPIFAGTPSLKVLLDAGVRAVQSTPMVSHNGVLVGMLSTHYRKPKRPTDRDLRLIDLLARQSADLIGKIRAEGELLATQQQLLSITDNMAAAVTRCSSDYRYVWVSPACAAWLGIPKEQIEGRRIADVIGPQAFEGIRPYVERVLSGERVDYTAPVYYRTLGERWVHAVYIPAISGKGVVEGWTAVITDVTDSKQYEAQVLKANADLERANADLARANEDLNQFAFAASHDLQEPLRMITAYSQLLVRSYRGELDPESATYIEFVVEGTKRMGELLSDLLDYVQLAGKGEEKQAAESVDLNRVFQKVVENCKAAIDETAAAITSDGLPTVLGQEQHFIQVLQNLISNALKYRSDQAPRVHVSVERQGAQWQVRVSDNGVGIDPKYHKRIFGVFKRLHGRAISGTGIGLAICQRVVDRYGGRIWVESQVGQGATFYFTLPAEKEAAAHE
jgi:PAS domain S-box-containing protein